ncbi:hypothetical protein PENCOP_c002G05388 [Penicillium coprophilum]|uniref:Cutinase n=1 Tax=Penicillium coprophilum TaxID=36646 RepID=A0A1V6V292_9EURO|nr:hypothetical protein PENCOP_c002G05388 [Penicillium coprophilum]
MYDTIVKIIWALLALTLILTQTHAQSVSEDDCATGVHAIIARGQGGGDDLNVLITLSDLILKQIPGSTTIGLPYDHENVLNDTAKMHTVHDGAVLMQQFVQEYVESCPSTKIVVVGYSMGAVLMMDSLCGTSEVGFFFVAPLAPFYNSITRQFSGVRSKPLILSQNFTRSTQVPHRLYSNPPRSSPPRAPSAPQSSRSNFPIIPIIIITAISSGAYIYLVKTRTGVNKRPN